MSSHAAADDGGNVQDTFSPEVLDPEDDAALAEVTRMRSMERLDALKEVMQESDAVLVRLDSTWWGNEAFGVWGDYFLVKPDSVSPSGKALFVDEGVKMSEVVGKVTSAKNILNSVGGLNSEAARRIRRKATDWFDDSKKPGPGMPPTDERDSFRDASVPLSVIRCAVRYPESDGHLIMEDEVEYGANAGREGKMSEGDIKVVGTKQSQYGTKFVLSGDTYKALSSKGDNLSDEVDWGKAHLTFDGDDWVCDCGSNAISHVIKVLVENGYSVAVDEEHAATVKRPGELFG